MHVRIQRSRRDLLITNTHLKASKSEDGEEVRFLTCVVTRQKVGDSLGMSVKVYLALIGYECGIYHVSSLVLRVL